MSRIYIEDIQKELKEEKWKLVSEEYKNLDSELIFLCPEGHRVYTSWRKLRNKKNCPVCSQNEFKEQEDKVIIKKSGEKRILALNSIRRNTVSTKYGCYYLRSVSSLTRNSYELCLRM